LWARGRGFGDRVRTDVLAAAGGGLRGRCEAAVHPYGS
jgi:hypothetical protein